MEVVLGGRDLGRASNLVPHALNSDFFCIIRRLLCDQPCRADHAGLRFGW